MIVQASNIEQVRSTPQQRGGGSAQAADRAVAQSRAHPPAESAESAREVVAAINRAAKSLNNSVELSLDTQSGRPIVRVVDTETGQLVRQIPTEEVLELRRVLDQIAGMLIRQKA